MSRGRGERHLPVARPVVLDLLVVAAALFLVVVPASTGQNEAEFGVQPTTVSVSLAVVASILLILRRRHPRLVWLAAVTLGLTAISIDGGASLVYAPAIIALYTFATLNPARLTVPTALVTAMLPGAVASLVAESVMDTLARGLTAWCLLAAAAGIAVRTQRAVVAEARERARLAEASRDEEAQRRVADERLRIARELHDVVAHHVSVANVQAGVAAHLLRSDPDQAAEALAHVRAACQVVLSEVPAVLGLLRTGEELERAPAPSLADAGALVEAARRSGLDLTWTTSGAPVDLGAAGDLTAYRVLQEALTNAARHGSGRTSASLVYRDDGVTLEVCNERSGRDSGPGEARHGLVGMRERVASVGGDLTVGPDGDRGWIVRMHLPRRHSATMEVS